MFSTYWGIKAKQCTESGKTDWYGSKPGFEHIDSIGTSCYGIFGTAEKNQNLDSSGIASMLTNTVGQSSNSGMMNMAAQLLDADKDGSFIDDVGNILGKLFKK